ncbi:hypothetical protein [Treponema sp. Marseille-Q3903]|jgi:hypothetical protein|uniref:hypothetical protein n=1 Tax=Treponema sp. Marseille-Q3903 TaxID=2766703 RepID=UPI00165214F1|nr:hypothetical protein [Treponema sp. Marseille-Q3903]MBC6714343.1 hypothetical protein [Treponema sp. Marseille-Q3903]
MSPEILLFIIKLIAGGIVAFLAILMMSRTMDFAWTMMVAGFLFSYAALVYELLIKLGVFVVSKYSLFGIPITTLIFVILPSVCFITSLTVMIIKSRK